MRVGVTGATGFVGRKVVAAFLRRGDAVVALTRNPASVVMPGGAAAAMPGGATAVHFDINEDGPDPQPIEGLDAVVHLAGETVNGRWTPAKKQAIFDSRVRGTRKLVDSIAACVRPPRILACASASGYYGDRGVQPLDENSAPGSDFLASVCVAWEQEARQAERLGLRVASLRLGVVLGAGGALDELVPIFKRGLGGPLGSGKQWMPWIHIDDLTEMFCFVLDRDDMRGPIAAVTPDYAMNHRVMQALGNALGRPSIAIGPGFALRAILGEFAETLLGGQLIIPTKALDAGFVWRQPRLESALIDLLAPGSGRASALQTFESDQFVSTSPDAVFAFFADARNLERLTPPSTQLRMEKEEPVEMRRGAVIDYSLRVRGVRTNWRAMICAVESRKCFVDIQLIGPFVHWMHGHEFEKKDGGVRILDRVEFSLPFAPLTNIALPVVRHDIERLFKFRRRAIEEIFAA